MSDIVRQNDINMKKCSYRLADDQFEQLKSEAKEKGLTPSSLLRMILSQRYSLEQVQPPQPEQKSVKTPENKRGGMYKDTDGKWRFA